MLLNLKTLDWDPPLLKLFGVPRAILPEVRDSAVQISARPNCSERRFRFWVAGDQQAASIGQACFSPGDVKSTYGTGCFVLVNTGTAICKSNRRWRRLYRRGARKLYAIEGSIFIAGAVAMAARCRRPD